MYLKEVMCEFLVCIINYHPLVKVRSDEGSLHKMKEFFDQESRYQFLKSRPIPQSYFYLIIIYSHSLKPVGLQTRTSRITAACLFDACSAIALNRNVFHQ
jgi:hypothetical protein